jgi:Ca2+-transporting ATPase
VNILIIVVTLVVIAIPEGNSPALTNILELTSCLYTGPPLAITLALTFAMKQMTKEDLLVCVLRLSETMANALVICTNKTRTLTQNEMTTVAGSIGVMGYQLVCKLMYNCAGHLRCSC